MRTASHERPERFELKTWRQVSRGKYEKASSSSLASFQVRWRVRQLRFEGLHQPANWAGTSVASGWSKMVRTKVATQGWEDLATLVSRSLT